MNFQSPNIIDNKCFIIGNWTTVFFDRINKVNDKYKERKINCPIEQYIIDKYKDDKNKEIIKRYDKNLILTKNIFPYKLYGDYNHYTVWDFDNNYFKKDIFAKIVKDYPNKDLILWENNNKNKSVKNITHYQIIIKEKQPKYILKKLIIIARHGPREPISYFKKLPKNIWPSKGIVKNGKDAQMTKKGLLYCLYNGIKFKHIYNNFIDIENCDINIFSSPVKRCIDSVKFFMKCFTKQKIDIYQDIFLAGFQKLNFEQIKEYKKHKKTLKINNKNLNKQLLKIFGFKVTEPWNYFEAYSILCCYKFEKYVLPKEWTVELDNELEKYAREFYNKFYDNINCSKHISGDIMKKIKSILKNDYLENQQIFYMSTHDTNLMALLKLYNSNEYYKIPKFSSNVRIEVWESNDKLYPMGKSTRIYYDDLLIKEINN